MKTIQLKVPYFSQRDNKREWWRTCNSSCCAMAAEYFRPGCVGGSDDNYLDIVAKYGDTTDHMAQEKALMELGIDSRFSTRLSYQDLNEELESGCPVVIGVFHRGKIFNLDLVASHMIIVVGSYPDGYICHDPWGEGFDSNYDLIPNGAFVRYPRSSLDKRWLYDGHYGGWGRIFHNSPPSLVDRAPAIARDQE